MSLKVLFLSDTHLGFDTPARPRSSRRRRGPDFFANYHKALAPAFRGEVDLVIHGGDMFFRSKLPPGLVARAFEPLRRLADRDIPIFVVPGNHERSRIPFPLLTAHPMIHIFDKPRTFQVTRGGITVALSGFPYARDVRTAFPDLVAQTGWPEVNADVRLLCVHHCIEGAEVANYRFTNGADVIRCSDLPGAFAACLSGHIHRHQVLLKNLKGEPLKLPVIYPGSIERTSFAEKDETKGYMILEFHGDPRGGHLHQFQFHDLPTRIMVQRDLKLGSGNEIVLKTRLWQTLAQLPQNGIVQLRIVGPLDEQARRACQTVRKLAPATMNLEISFGRNRRQRDLASTG